MNNETYPIFTDKDHNLAIARRIVENDTKNVANIVANMNFSSPSGVNFCQIFGLEESGRCNRFRFCTDCIDAYLIDYAIQRLQENDAHDNLSPANAPWPKDPDEEKAPKAEQPSVTNTSCDGCGHQPVEGRVPAVCVNCRRPYAGAESWNWKKDNFTRMPDTSCRDDNKTCDTCDYKIPENRNAFQCLGCARLGEDTKQSRLKPDLYIPDTDSEKE